MVIWSSRSGKDFVVFHSDPLTNLESVLPQSMKACVEETNDDDVSSDDDSIECLKLFLGGIDLSDIGPAAELEQHHTISDAQANDTLTAVTKRTHVKTSKAKQKLSPTYGLDDSARVDNDNDWETIFSLAHRHGGRPPVCVVQIPGRGNALIATQLICKGDVLFTERAAFASQTNFVRACQRCFRSLEPPPDTFPLLLQWNVEIARYCETCPALFCSLACQQHGNCCAFQPSKKTSNAAVQLAMKMFHSLLQRYRSAESLIDWTRGLCGLSSDCHQLGLEDLSNDYDTLVKQWDMTNEECDMLSLECFQRLVAAACRNSFGVRTQSPFKPYYAAVLRQCGRNSEMHHALRNAISHFLGASLIETENTLQRGMDRDMDDRFAPELICIFPLISRINHSCDPNAQVISQTFVDYHVDLVAAQDIGVGEEVLISYLPPMKRSERRKQFLKARFLFDCNCSACEPATR